jgi:predicted hotdog family 3-hydroxylacyl-ACP dehydratase
VLAGGAIAALLPHAGKMVLLERVTAWDRSEITCLTSLHRDRGNPLRRGGRLSCLCGVEFAAQAMALHGALVAGGSSRPGVLASLKNVRCHVERLDDIGGDLRVCAGTLFSQRDSFIYEFSLWSAETPLLDGQAAVFLR